MKIFKIMMMALVAMCGLNSCSDDCDHDFIEVDYSKDIVGIWTYMAENGQAEAMVINPDGSFNITGVMKGGILYEEKGTIKVVNNKVTLVFEGDKETFEGRLEFVSGKSMSLVMFDDNDVRLDYDYCKEDLSDEIVGMWVCNETPSAEKNDMLIMTYNADGTTIFTGYAYEADVFSNNVEASYMVIGDLLIHKQPDIAVEHGLVQYNAMKIEYTPNGSPYGDVKTLRAFAVVGENYVVTTTSWLRISQSLNLAGKAYDYSATYISNAKGADKDIPFLDTKFNFAHMDGSIIDKFLKSVLYNVQFPDAKTFQYNCLLEGQNVSLQLPMEVEGNKITIKMSSRHASYRDVVVYAFQDADCSQFHMYMPTASFENFFSNLSLSILSASGQVDINNPVHVDAVYKEVADAIESINVSIVMK